ncbi:ferredoxin [Caloranaerobacter sp. TR13]|nr:ferredoxin [Caloranaerobacter sp. TR13]
MIIEDKVKEIGDSNYFLCMDEACDVVYYNEESKKFTKKDVKVPIWFKIDANPKYICYCNKVTEKQIEKVIIEEGARNVKDVIKLTGAMKSSQCKIKNPTGNCCYDVVKETVDKILKKI